MTVPELEKFTGVGVYKSKTEGVGGTIKQIPEDFLVEEITQYGEVCEIGGKDKSDTKIPGEYLHFTLQKTKWETLRAIKELARRAGISRNRFGFAGTKDKNAITLQRISVWNGDAERFRQLDVRDIELRDFVYDDEPLNLGDLQGNRFGITVRNIELGAKEIGERIKKISRELESGVPAFFGVQRFGIARPITHLVGKEIIRGNFEEAVMIYLSRTFGKEEEESEKARKELAESRDFKAALANFPKHLGYEKAMLNYLVEKPGDFAGAIKRLPKGLKMMFVHAYQSFIFNRALSEYIERGIVVEKLPLVGYESRVDEITRRILEEEDIGVENFRVRELPRLRSRGIYRDCFFRIDKFDSGKPEKDELNAGKRKIQMRFSLEKGNYATVVLREFIKGTYW